MFYPYLPVPIPRFYFCGFECALAICLIVLSGSENFISHILLFKSVAVLDFFLNKSIFYSENVLED